MMNMSWREVPKGAITQEGSSQFGSGASILPMPAMLPIIRRCSPSEEPNRALGARTHCRRAAQLLHRGFCFAAGWLRSCGGEVTNKSVPLNQEERCVCACACTLLISQSCSCVHPLLPPPPFKTGDCLQSQYALESYPALPASISPLTPARPPPPPHSNSWRGHMVHSIYRSPPVVRLQGISVCIDKGLNENKKRGMTEVK